MKIRLYLDEDAMRIATVKALQTQGIDVTTVQDARTSGYEDADQLRFALEQQRVIYTFNIKHFASLHTLLLEQGRSHADIIVAQKYRYSVGEQSW